MDFSSFIIYLFQTLHLLLTTCTALDPIPQSDRTNFQLFTQSEVTCTSSLSEHNCIQQQFRYTSNKGCRCYLFQSSGGSQGNFKSPNYPTSYPANINCILYTFVGDLQELVEVSFVSFRMREKSSLNKCYDYLRLFLNLERAELSMTDQSDYEFCGSKEQLPQHRFYSKGRVLVIEFHTDYSYISTSNFLAFSGTFKFLNKRQFVSSGVAVEDNVCSRNFNRSTLSGQFFSPRYPQNYPPGVNCYYQFTAALNERVIVNFNKIQLDGKKSKCDSKEETDSGDRIEIMEGATYPGRTLARLCGSTKPVQVVSHGSRMLVVFKSDRNGFQNKGFDATYQYVEERQVEPSAFFGDQNVPSHSDFNSQERAPDRVQSTERKYTWRMSHSGNIYSPDYPKPYPPNIQMIYKFQAGPSQRVRLTFQIISLDDSVNENCINYDGDRLEIFDGMSDSAMQLGTLCGMVTRQHSFASSRSSLVLKFLSDYQSHNNGKGFIVNYQFIAFPHPQSQPRKSYEEKQNTEEGSSPENTVECGHEIDSKGKSVSGIVATPNYPNGYPPKISCSWKFIGQQQQRIILKFESVGLANSGQNLYGSVCQGGDLLQIHSYVLQQSLQIERDVLKFCDQKSIPYSVMSASMPKMIVVFTSANGSLNKKGGVALKYEFVSDYGVMAKNARLPDKSKCEFQIFSIDSLQGNFTSPNYPGFYPYDLTCLYRFNGEPSHSIYIKFIEFDIQSDSPTCESTHDYLEISSCPGSLYYTRQYPTSQKLCSEIKGKFNTIRWPSSCLLIRFVSDHQFVRKGFLATYTFKKNVAVQLNNYSSLIPMIGLTFLSTFVSTVL